MKHLKARYLVTNENFLNWFCKVNPNLFYFLLQREWIGPNGSSVYLLSIGTKFVLMTFLKKTKQHPLPRKTSLKLNTLTPVFTALKCTHDWHSSLYCYSLLRDMWGLIYQWALAPSLYCRPPRWLPQINTPLLWF